MAYHFLTKEPWNVLHTVLIWCQEISPFLSTEAKSCWPHV